MLKCYPKAFIAVLLILLIKLVLIFLLPITGDEAYFVKWGEHLALGYYDHPPMVGWLIYLMHFIVEDIAFFRLFSFITTLVLAYIIFLFTRKSLSQEKACLTALLFLASPVDLLMSLFTNDIPLVLFGSVGAYLFYLSLEKLSWRRYAVGAGIFLGAAFLSKYFAVFLMFSLVIFAFVSYGRRAWKSILLTTVVVLPFVMENLYFNYMHCWNNIMFNFMARPQSHVSLQYVGLFLGLLLYIATPWGLWMLRKAVFMPGAVRTMVASVLGVAFVVLLVVSFKNKVGLHWFLLFIPYIYMLYAYLDGAALKKLFWYNFIFTLVHGIVLLIILLLPLSAFEKSRSYSSIVYAVKPEEVCKRLEVYGDDELYTMGYTSAAMLSYACKREIRMLFNTSKYGRMDDALMDVRRLNDKNITVFRHKPIRKESFKEVCQQIELESFMVEDATFYLAKCYGFSYKEYKKGFINPLFKRYYNIPSWLPQGKCYMREMYQMKK